jgi:hypothetical protein
MKRIDDTALAEVAARNASVKHVFARIPYPFLVERHSGRI